MTLVWSTKFHLFLYRFISSLKFSDNNEKNSKNIEFEIDKSAHIYLQLATDCR